jgi:hypothetical protein
LRRQELQFRTRTPVPDSKFHIGRWLNHIRQTRERLRENFTVFGHFL